MKIVDFTEEWIPAAEQLVSENYREERLAVPALPEMPVVPSLIGLVENGLGVAAVEDDMLLGFMGAYGPWGPVFCTGNVRGVFVPLHAHGAKRENRERIYQWMYQAAAEKWVNAGAASHAITLYAHDTAAKTAFFTYGFGMRCMDLIRDLKNLDQTEKSKEYTYFELSPQQHRKLRSLRRALSDHLAQSPCFMRESEEDLQFWLNRKEAAPPRVFAAEKDGRIIAYVEVTEKGENFAVSGPEVRNICGAYCLPEYRDGNVAKGLLQFVAAVLKSEGFTRLGVDCESFNPTAQHFWRKHFTAYTNSVVRRIDENAISI